MNKLFLLTAVSSMGLQGLAADLHDPKLLENFNAYAISANAKYVVSQGMTGLSIFSMDADKTYDYLDDSPEGLYTCGMGKCVSNNGTVLGYAGDIDASYWKDGVWHIMEIPSYATSTNLVNSITPDGSRVCGSIGVASMNYSEDVLMQAPCIWNWDPEKNDFGTPVMLPHPELDFSGRVPQIISAIDISDDGKTIVGQVTTATGMYHYPIIYVENESGEWSYRIPDQSGLNPDGLVFPEYPGDDAPTYPSQESYMTPEQIAAYTKAMNEYYASGYTIPCPEYEDFMTPESILEYEKAFAEYQEKYAEWDEKFSAWMMVYYEIVNSNPDYEFNSIRISPDGKHYANTVLIEEEGDDFDFGFSQGSSNIWVFDTMTGAITKYDQQEDFILTYMANDGVALASVKQGIAPQSFVLKDGEAIEMKTWISEKSPSNGKWLEENMTEEVEDFILDEATGAYDIIYHDVVLTGRACATPDLSVIALGVENVDIWAAMDDGKSIILDMNIGTGVDSMRPAQEEKTIYDLSGRKLTKAAAPGIYIINGEKKAVR